MYANCSKQMVLLLAISGVSNHVLLFMFSLNFPSKMCRGLEPNQNIAEINSYEHVVFHMNWKSTSEIISAASLASLSTCKCGWKFARLSPIHIKNYVSIVKSIHVHTLLVKHTIHYSANCLSHLYSVAFWPIGFYHVWCALSGHT